MLDLQEVHEKVDALAEEVDRVEGYIEQALFYARSESLDRDYVVRNVSLQSIVSSALKRNARAMISAHVAPVCRGLELGVFADEKWVEALHQGAAHSKQCEIRPRRRCSATLCGDSCERRGHR